MLDALTDWINDNRFDIEAYTELNGDSCTYNDRNPSGELIRADELLNHIKENDIVSVKSELLVEVLLSTLYGCNSKDEDIIRTKIKLALPVIAQLSNK